MALRCVLATAAALVAGAACCPSAGAIYGGTQVPILQHPYQVALVNAGTAAAARDGQYCGGAVRDAWHVVTAAHCVYEGGQPRAANTVDVLAGTNNLTDETGHRFAVAKVSYMPYDQLSYADDAALLTLAQPLPLSDTIQPVTFIDEDWAGIDEPNAGLPLYVTGWGITETGLAATVLRGVDVKYITDQTCSGSYLFQETKVQICAGDIGKDACQGDSGGPLVQRGTTSVDGDRLVGLVSAGGTKCDADPDFPGLYTEVAAPAIQAFLQQPDPPAAPTSTSPPVLSGSAAIGQRLTCNPGVWTGAPTLSYQFVRSTAAGDVGVAASGSQADYVVTSQDVGTSLRCVVTGTNPGGASTAESSQTGVVAAPPPAAQPQPQPQPQPTPQPPQTSLDVYAPVAKVAKTTCTSTRCTLTVRVTDAGFSAGIKTVKASVKSTYRTTCKRKGKKKKVACTKTKSGRATVSALAATRFKVVASKLPVGKQVFTLIAVDKAGHRQALPTTKTVTTKKPKKKRSAKRR